MFNFFGGGGGGGFPFGGFDGNTIIISFFPSFTNVVRRRYERYSA
jgi:hypothetical protein